MTLRSKTGALTLDRDSLAHAFPRATGRIALLVHGLMANESIWECPGDPDTTFGSLLARDHAVTPIYLRYNTGQHISVNGRELAGLLHRLVSVWPVPVHDISLIGHSMGGLVMRSSCHYASATRSWRGVISLRRSWISKTRRVVLIGVPNTGAPLEKFVNLTSAALWSLPIPITRLVGLGLDTRSAGIRDLRFGAITDEDWLEQDPRARQRPVPHRLATRKREAYLIIAGGIAGAGIGGHLRHFVKRGGNAERDNGRRALPGIGRESIPQDDSPCTGSQVRRVRRNRSLVALTHEITAPLCAWSERAEAPRHGYRGQ
jgi:pimeloyl-ACP methyl ester carboxylesterase